MRWPVVACLLLIMLLAGASLAGTANALATNVASISRAGHISVTYTTGSIHVANDAGILDDLEKAYDRVNGRFGTCPGRVEVVIIDDGAMDEEAGKQVDAFSAWNKAMSAVVLRRTAVENRSFPVVAEHEMAHLAVNEILCNKDPREFQWMEEGICTLVSNETFDDADVSKYIVEHGFLGVRDIPGAIKSENCTVSKNGYMQSYSLVRRIAQKHGLSAVIDMLECPDARLDEAFRKCTGEDFPVFYKEWEKEVRATAS